MSETGDVFVGEPTGWRATLGRLGGATARIGGVVFGVAIVANLVAHSYHDGLPGSYLAMGVGMLLFVVGVVLRTVRPPGVD